MNTKLKYLHIILSMLVVAGLFGSLTHYHSESMECLQHADEQHYVQNEEVLCPSCTLVSIPVISVSHTNGLVLPDAELVFVYTDRFTDQEYKTYKSLRAPPSVI